MVDRFLPVTGDLSPLVSVSFLTSLLNTDEVRWQALRTAATATCSSVAYECDILRDRWMLQR